MKTCQMIDAKITLCQTLDKILFWMKFSRREQRQTRRNSCNKK